MHVLITGAGGFIGRNVACKAKTRGWKVTGVARRQCKEADRIADLRYPISDLEVPDAVIHLAGSYAGCRTKEFVNGDIAIARNLLEWGRQKGIRRWVFASAAEVYGDVNGEAAESYPCQPVIPYGKAKLEIERMFFTAELPEVMVCRIGEVYGPGGRIIYELGGKLRKGFCPWPGNGSVTISFVHVEDVAEALSLACEHAKPGFNIYNVGDDKPATWRQFLDEMATLLKVRSAYFLPKYAAYCYAVAASWMDRLLGRPANITPQVLRLLVTPKVISSVRLRNELGFIPQYADFRIGLKQTLRDPMPSV
jgi:nucleoside-diphosphate-sugar epimerase